MRQIILEMRLHDGRGAPSQVLRLENKSSRTFLEGKVAPSAKS